MATLYRRGGSRNWMMAVTIAGKQVCRSTGERTKDKAREELGKWEKEISDGQKPALLYFQKWADDFQTRGPYESTRKRYESSIKKLKEKFTGIRLSDISAEQIDDYIKGRLAENVQPSTINHDLRVLRRMMRLAERRQLIPRNSSVEFEFLKQQAPRLPHIVTFEEKEK